MLAHGHQLSAVPPGLCFYRTFYPALKGWAMVSRRAGLRVRGSASRTNKFSSRRIHRRTPQSPAACAGHPLSAVPRGTFDFAGIADPALKGRAIVGSSSGAESLWKTSPENHFNAVLRLGATARFAVHPVRPSAFIRQMSKKWPGGGHGCLGLEQWAGGHGVFARKWHKKSVGCHF